MTWERQALEQLVEQLVLQYQTFNKKMTVLEVLGIEVTWESESFEVITAMIPNWEDFSKPPADTELNKRYTEIVLYELEKQFKTD